MAAPARVMGGAALRPKHIVDQLIEERAPHWVAMPVWPLIRPLLYGILDYGKAVRLADAIRPLPGGEALEHVSAMLRLSVAVTGLGRVPAKGRVVVILNHPTGIADGVAVYDALKPVRRDLVFFANADALRVSPGFADVMVPVEWIEEKRSREKTRLTLQRARAALEAERAMVIFPSGRLARKR
ncbi:MAG TPA: 1-acyl-sn-glycerol-3-phosphate acyltransferase, partial [Polyangia bacterium]|nr:1-acyl-sn-glycerol-3-phosphate acyltransferase [Polyangia bacterium]